MKNRNIFNALFVIVLLFTACGKSVEDQIMEQLELGQRCLLEANYEEAVVAFQKAIELDEKQAEAYIGLADVYIAQEEFEQAQAILVDGMNKSEDSEMFGQKTKELEEAIHTQEIAAASQAADSMIQELGSSMGFIDVSNYIEEKQGISSFARFDVDADEIDELLVTYISGDFSGELDSCALWAALYDYQDGQMVLSAEQQIGTVSFCDAMTARLIFSEQQAAFCIVTNKELVGAYTGAQEFVSELYKIEKEEIQLKRHWMQNSIENLNDGPDKIIAEMQRVGIPYMDMIYFQYGMETASDAKEQILFRNTVGVQGEYASERRYELYFSTYEELNIENATNEFRVGQSEAQLLKTRSETELKGDELKESVREALCVIENLYRGSNGVEIDRENYITGPGYPAFDDFYAEAVGFQSMEEVKSYVHSMVSDRIYEKYFDEEKYMEVDGKVFFRISTSGSKMDMDSLEIESIDGDIYRISIDEYLGQEYYLKTVLIMLQKTDEGWKVLEEERDAIDKGYTKRYGGTEGDFI